MGQHRRQWNPMEQSLACVLASFEGVPVVVELRNENLVRGTLETVDHSMNLSMTNAIYTKFQGEKQSLDSIYIKGRNIRMVHLPHKIDCTKQLKQMKRRENEAKAAALQSALGPDNRKYTYQQ